MVIAAMKLKDAYSWTKSYDQPRYHIEKQRYYSANKGPSSQGYILLPCLFNLYAEYIMRNAGLEEAQAEIKIAGLLMQYKTKENVPQDCLLIDATVIMHIASRWQLNIKNG